MIRRTFLKGRPQFRKTSGAVSIIDLELPFDQKELPDEVVFKRRPGLEVAERFVGALVDRVHTRETVIQDTLLGVVQAQVTDQLADHHTVDDRVHHQAGGVPHVGGAQDGQHQVGAGPQAVEPERLPEVLFLARDPVVQGRDVDQPAQPHRGVDADPAERVDGLFDLELQQRVRQVGDFGEVSERASWECSPQFLKTLIM